MVSELGLAGGPGFESSPCNLIPIFIWKSIMDANSPHAWVWGHMHVREGKHDIHIKLKSYKFELLGELVI